MNEPISWDHTLVKKYSSSNHYKLLNQLRNEVKKYPLKNKKRTSSIESNATNLDVKNNLNVSQKQNSLISNNSNHTNDFISNKTTVSFNNSKNFSIYNQTNNNNFSVQNDSSVSEPSESNDGSYSSSFKERLNQIDMK